MSFIPLLKFTKQFGRRSKRISLIKNRLSAFKHTYFRGDAPNQQDQLYNQFKERFPGIDIEIIVECYY